MSKQPYKYRFILICVFLIAAIVAVYWPVYFHKFLKYDDDLYVTNNINIHSGLNFKSIHWAFTAGYASNWHPVTWISHMLDWQLYGNWAGGHHLTNVFFHILNTLILFYVLMRMTGAVWPSAFVAAAFALHPLHVESVAWIAERKDLLSTFFWLLTMWAYVRYVEKPKLKWYLTAIVLFILGLMSKPMLVTLPFVLLLLDYWPLQRKFSRWLLIEKIPFFLCSFVSCIITYFIQQRGGATIAVEILCLKTRIANAFISYLTYITNMIWPSRLAVLYPHPGDAFSVTKAIISGLLLVIASVIFIYLGRRRRFFTVGWFWYLGTLVPVIGLVQVGVQSMADRYTYMTLTGLFIIIAFSANEFVPKLRYRNLILSCSAVAVLTGWAFTASVQLKYWKDSLPLFEHTLQVTENNPLILEDYATYLSELGRFDEAIEQSNKFLKMKPNSPQAHNNLGNIFLRTGKLDQAIEQFRLAIKCDPGFPQAYFNLASALKKQGKPQDAIEYFKQTIKIKPDFVDAYLNLGITLNEMGKSQEAVEYFNKALEFDPGNVLVHGYLGMALAEVGKTDEAIKEIRFVLKARPADAEMYRNLGILLEKKDDTAAAIEAYRAALRIDPNQTPIRQLLDDALKKQKGN
ncbi:MAG: tetratricopeptide repeat protein [Sedimentisphaerales bacterium]|jgi:tetratricopeptide (TPR) repeat protein